MSKKARFTHVRGNLRGDVSEKRFSAHVAEGNVADVAKKRLSDGTGSTDTGQSHVGSVRGHCYMGNCYRILPQGTITVIRHRILQRITATDQRHSSTSQWHINKDTPDDFSSGVSEERQLPTLPPGLAVPSAMTGLASLFGMGRGGSPSL